MAVQKNVQFSVVVRIEGRLREFNFRKRSDTRYDGDTSDERGGRWQFSWKLEEQQWQPGLKNATDPALPSWLVNNASTIREGFLVELL